MPLAPWWQLLGTGDHGVLNFPECKMPVPIKMLRVSQAEKTVKHSRKAASTFRGE